MNSLTIKVYIASGYNAGKGKLILNNVEYPFDNVMPDSDNAYELYFGFANPITLPATGQLYIINASDEIEPFDHNSTIQVNQGYAIWNYDYNNPCYMEFELEQDGQSYGDPSIEFGSVSDPWYYNQYVVSSCNTPSYYELKCGFNYGGSVRPAKTFIRWGTNEPYTQITYGGVNPEYFSWQEQSVPSDEIGTLVVEFTDANNNGLTVDSYSSQDYVFDTDTAGSYGGTRLLIKSPDDSNIYDYAAGNFIECNITLSAAPQPTYENTVVFTGATVSQVDIDADNGEGYVTFNVVNNTIQFDDGDFWSMKKLTTTNGDIVSSVDYSYPDGTTGTNTITNPEDQIAGHYEDPGTMNITVNSTFPYAVPDLTGRRFGNAENEESWYFTAQNAVHYQNGCGEGNTSIDLNITAWIWNPNSWPQIGWTMQTDGDLNYYYDPVEDKFYDNYTDYYPEIYYDPCTGPTEPDLTGNWYVVNDATEGFHFISSNLVQWDMCDHESTSDINLNWIEGTAIGNYGPWYFTDGSSKYYYNATDNTLGDSYEDGPIENIYTYSASGLSCGGPQPTEYTVSVDVTGQGTTTGAGTYNEGDDVTLTATPASGWRFDHWYDNDNQETIYDNPYTIYGIDGDYNLTAVFLESTPAVEKHIYLCDNSGAHLAEMTNTGSTWNVTGAFTSGMYSIRATVEGEYNDAWFKFYQTSGDNRVFVGAGDDSEFTDIGTYIMIDDILTSFSLEEDQTTGYYVVSYENTRAMTVSTVETIVNSYIGELNIPTDTSDLTNGAGFITVSDVSAMSYVDSTTLSSMGYLNQSDISSMSYVDQTSLSSMAYVDNTYLSTYMNAVVGDINAILQTI